MSTPTTTIAPPSAIDSHFDRLRAPFQNVPDDRAVSAFHQMVGYLAGHAARGYSIDSVAFAQNALDMAREVVEEGR